MKRVLILGGGFGGVAAARRARASLPEDDEVVLVDRGTHFVMGFRKTGAIVGRDAYDDGARPLAALAQHGITVQRGEITAIDTAARAAEVDGRRIEADALLVALGAERDPAAIEGLAEHAIDVYDPARIPEAAASLRRPSGHLILAIAGQPYVCPPAPFELAILAQQAARAAGSKLTFQVTTPLPMSLPVLGKAGCEAIEARLLGQFIEFSPNTTIERVEQGSLETSTGSLAFDVLWAIPPHRVPSVVSEAGLAPPDGWIAVDARSGATSAEGVWAVGDCVSIPTADGKPMPKAGEFAQAAGTIAADHMVAAITGGTTDAAFWGDGRCFLEIGDGEAMVVQGRFLAEDGPEVALSAPSEENLAEKIRFERDRLDEWFGPA